MASGFFNENIPKTLEKAKEKMEFEVNLMKEEQRIKDQQEVEKRRIREKQIRALRNRYRPAGGFLNEAPRGLDLGTAPGLPNKLGS